MKKVKVGESIKLKDGSTLHVSGVAEFDHPVSVEQGQRIAAIANESLAAAPDCATPRVVHISDVDTGDGDRALDGSHDTNILIWCD